MYGTVTDPALRVMGAPREYIQGPRALEQLPHVVRRCGRGRLFAVVDPFLMASVGARLQAMFAGGEGSVTLQAFGGECTEAEGERLAALAGDADVVAGVGGGKCVDIGKYVALARNLPVIAVPTIASNDAPTSRLVVLYDDHHAVSGLRYLPFNPDVVLVDTDVIAGAPARFLRAGMGDALTKFFEARSVAAGTGTNVFSGRPPFVVAEMGRICLDTILEAGPACHDAAMAGQRGEGFERLVEALILLSGITFESGGLSIAHSLIRGLTKIPSAAAFLHGEQVAYGVLVQLAVEGDETWLPRVRAFSQRVGLPVRLADFGIPEPDRGGAVDIIAAGTLTAPYMSNFPRPLGAGDLADAIRRLEALP